MQFCSILIFTFLFEVLNGSNARFLATTPVPCAFSQKTTGVFTVPKPNCQLSGTTHATGQIILSGDFTCKGVQGETPLRELIASSTAVSAKLPRRLFVINLDFTLTLMDLKIKGGHVVSGQNGGNIFMSNGKLVMNRVAYVVGHSLGRTADRGGFLYANGFDHADIEWIEGHPIVRKNMCATKKKR